MKTSINAKIELLRQVLKEMQIDAIVIPTSDPHMSEYIPSHWKIREWLSGFTGSAGTLVITQNKAGLWTDSRYYLQASKQLEHSLIQLFKDGLIETPSIFQFLNAKLPKNSIIAIDGETISVHQYEQWSKELPNMHIEHEKSPISKIWDNRPQLPTSPCFIYDEKYAGKSCSDKIKEIRKKSLISSDQILLLTALDEIAWVLNIRGEEIKNNPVVISYLVISQKDCTLFIDPLKVNNKLNTYLNQHGIQIKPYSSIYNYLSNLNNKIILFDAKTTNVKLVNNIGASNFKKAIESPVALLKAIRNKVELKNIKQAMIKDGIALVRFLIWLEKNVSSSEITEIDVAEKLFELRSQQSLFKGESFDTIAGYKEHGAIVHYSATPETNAVLKPKGFLLVDSGAQYLDGTTDITRTIALGELSEEEAFDYTLVLKGHIALASAKFPEGTRGSQLDILARLPLWENKKNFLHGTGHGVGHFLCVHEGPQSIRMNENPISMQPGMITSNEPGVYIANSHGIRIENLILVAPFGQGMFSSYYQFETITLCPICTKGIIKSQLTPQEIKWLNDYHEKVFNTLHPYLNIEEQMWLKNATAKF